MPFDASPAPAAAGIQWGPLFLPVGTRVWARFRGVEHEAVVDSAGLAVGDRFVTPAEFANGAAGHARNAWRDLWLLRPGLDPDFRLADDLRAELAGESRPLRSRPAPRGARAPKPAPVLSLVPFLIRAGGVQDPRGDIRAILGSVRARPGLISSRGLSLDAACQAALEAGFFPECVGRAGAEAESLAGGLRSAGAGLDSLTPAALLDAIDMELRGSPRWPGGVAPESAPEFDPDAELADRVAAFSEDAARWRALVAAAESGGAAAALRFLADAGILPPSAAGASAFEPDPMFDDCPF